MRVESNGRTARIDGGRGDPSTSNSREMLVGAGFFAASGHPAARRPRVRAGRPPGTPATVIVNQEFARKYVDGKMRSGDRFRFTEDSTVVESEIVGVVANSKYRTLGEELRPAMYCR